MAKMTRTAVKTGGTSTPKKTMTKTQTRAGGNSGGVHKKDGSGIGKAGSALAKNVKKGGM